LEIAVGTGRAAIPLAQAGHCVVGVDYDPNMLAIAKQKRDAVAISDRSLSLIRADALTLGLNETFDWICIFFNTFLGFTTLENQDQLLQRIRAHLKPKGRLWLDIFYPNLDLLSYERKSEMEPMAFYVPHLDRAVMKTVEIRRSSVQVQRIIFHYRWFDARGREHRQRTEFDMTWLFPRELRLLLERNGLMIDRMWGNYDGSPVTTKSARIIARCCRRN